jgi:hypothetical protein
MANTQPPASLMGTVVFQDMNDKSNSNFNKGVDGPTGAPRGWPEGPSPHFSDPSMNHRTAPRASGPFIDS